MQTLKGKKGLVSCVLYDGMKIVAGADDCMVHLYDGLDGEGPKRELKGHTQMVSDIAVAAFMLVSASWDNTCLVWRF